MPHYHRVYSPGRLVSVCRALFSVSLYPWLILSVQNIASSLFFLHYFISPCLPGLQAGILTALRRAGSVLHLHYGTPWALNNQMSPVRALTSSVQWKADWSMIAWRRVSSHFSSASFGHFWGTAGMFSKKTGRTGHGLLLSSRCNRRTQWAAFSWITRSSIYTVRALWYQCILRRYCR